ncbi:hypothetical protein [Roseateles sp.]|uniref:hypothetical protein n=1 Tax=Roseateles sp. TaxID=1971397 RepID=UPI002F41CFCD
MPAARIPGPLGAGAATHEIDDGTMIRAASPLVSPVGAAPRAEKAAAIDDDTRALAAVAYGEGSTGNVYEEMAAIANVLVRQQKARGFATISAFIKTDKTFAFAAHDGNQRHDKLKKATAEEIAADAGMNDAVRGARNALSATGTDYSNGGYFWDGADIKSNYDKHPKVKAGIHITDPKHNIYDIKDKDVPGEEWWRSATGAKTKLRGKWDYKYESTAAYGGTIFWKYNDDFVKATNNKVYD